MEKKGIDLLTDKPITVRLIDDFHEAGPIGAIQPIRMGWVYLGTAADILPPGTLAFYASPGREHNGVTLVWAAKSREDLKRVYEWDLNLRGLPMAEHYGGREVMSDGLPF